jgi:hypothetical protein
MNKYRARHKLTGKLIEVEFMTLEEAVYSNYGYTDWELIE